MCCNNSVNCISLFVLMVMVKTLQIMSFEIFSHVLAIGRLATTQYRNRMIRKTPTELTTFITSGIKDSEKMAKRHRF